MVPGTGAGTAATAGGQGHRSGRVGDGADPHDPVALDDDRAVLDHALGKYDLPRRMTPADGVIG